MSTLANQRITHAQQELGQQSVILYICHLRYQKTLPDNKALFLNLILDNFTMATYPNSDMSPCISDFHDQVACRAWTSALALGCSLARRPPVTWTFIVLVEDFRMDGFRQVGDMGVSEN